MNTPSTNHYKHHRFPAEIISHGVWLYYRFCLSYRDVEELLFARGIIVTYEAIRKWCRKFGQAYANELRRRRPRPGDKWHLDEVFLTINGARHFCGGRSIRMAMYWIFWSKAVETRRRRRSFSASC
jgi:putative transposase